MTQNVITFLGAGHLTYALISGLLANDYPAKKIWATNRSSEKLQVFRESMHVQTTCNNLEGVSHADVVIIAVKPNQVQEICQEIRNVIIQKKLLVISLAAGVRVSSIQKWLGQEIPIIRAMPNTPAEVMTGATALFSSDQVSAEQKNKAESIFRSVGLTLWFEKETDINIVTALSGCGPAYIFLVMDAMQKAAEKLGLPAEAARLLTLQTTLGASKIAMESGNSFEELKAKVAVPKGITEKAVAVLEQGGIQELFLDAMMAATKRAEEIGEMYS
jgi:pyrroline-5-carboxylate reductase